MVALCREHHDKADAGAYEIEDLRGFKRMKDVKDRGIGGRFDWMRRRLLGVIGSNYYHNTINDVMNLVVYKGNPLVQFKRDGEGRVLVSLQMPTVSGQPRLVMENNDWIVVGLPQDFECPPHGRKIRATYDGGDEISVEFFEVTDELALLKRYPSAPIEDLKIPEHVRQFVPHVKGVEFPVTAVEVVLRVGGTKISVTPKACTVGNAEARDCAFLDSGPTCLSFD